MSECILAALSIAPVFRAAKSSHLYVCQAIKVKIWCHLAVREAEKLQ